MQWDSVKCFKKKPSKTALTGVAQLVSCCSTKQGVTGSTSDVSLPLFFPPFPLSLKKQNKTKNPRPKLNGVFSFLFFFLRFYLLVEREREGETENLACNPGMCPDWELNQWPFSLQTDAQSTEPSQLGLNGVFSVGTHIGMLSTFSLGSERHILNLF